MLSKPECPVEIFNDLDDRIANLFHVLTDPVLFERFHNLCLLAPYNETLSDEFIENFKHDDEPEDNPALKAFMFWYINRSRHNGVGGFSINTVVRRSMSKSVSDMLSSVDGLPELHSRLGTVVVCNRDAFDLIIRYDRVKTFIYLDPPYVHSTRGSARYRVEASDEHHEQLVDVLNGLQYARYVLSGYDNPIYEDLVDCDHFKFIVNTTSGNGEPKTKVEHIWRNFS